MQSREAGQAIVARLDPGDDVPALLVELCTRHGVRCGIVEAIGAVRDVEIGAFAIGEKRYSKTKLEGDWEVLSLLATVSLVDGKPFVHAHVVLGDEACNVRGGHLFAATVAVTLECVLRPVDVEVVRELDPATGLRLMSFARQDG